MRTRSAVGVFVLGIAGALALWLGLRSAPDPELPGPPAPSPESPMAADPTATTAPVAPVARTQTPPQQAWLEALSGREEPLAVADDDPHAVVLLARLTVRQRPWVHPANVTIRLTQSFLDTLVPSETGNEDELVPKNDDPTTTTDAEGRFAFRFAPTPGQLFFLIDRAGPWLDLQRVRDVPRIGAQLDLGDVFVDDRGGITGRVVGPDELPIEGAVVRAVDDPLVGTTSMLGDLREPRMAESETFHADGTVALGPLPPWVVRRDRFLPFPTGRSDASGLFRLTGLRPGQHDVIVATERHGERRLQAVQVACDRTTDVGLVRLAEGIASRTRFVDERSRPWVGAAVAVLTGAGGFGPPAVRTDEDGWADLAFPRRTDIGCAFAYPGGGPWLNLGPPRSQSILVRRPMRTVLTLVDEQGAPVRGARVQLLMQGAIFRPVDRALPAAMQPHETAPGTYQGTAPPGTTLAAVASAPGLAPAIATVQAGGGGSLTMLRLFEVTVRTRDSHGDPVADAVVRIQAHRNPDLDFTGTEWDLLANDRARVGRTDEKGELRVPVWNTFLSFAAEHPRFALSAGPRLRPVPDQVIDLVLRQNGSVHGTLLVHGQPAPAGFRVRAQLKPPPGHELDGSGWLAAATAVTGDGGSFTYASLDAGLWEFEPELPPVPDIAGRRASSTRFRTGQVSLEEGQEVWFRLEAEPASLEAPRLCGSIRVDGVAQAGARVRVRKAPEAPSRGGRGREAWRRERDPRRRAMLAEGFEPPEATWDQNFTTDAFGTFAFAGLEADTDYEVRIDVPQQDRLQFLRREVVRTPRASETQPARVDVEVQSGGLYLVATRLGRAFANGMLRLRQIGKDGNDAACYEVLTDGNGQCNVDALPAGTWTVEPVHGGHCTPAEVTIEPGARPALSVVVVGM